VDAVVVPKTACGGSSLLSFSQTNAQIITVEENKTLMNLSAETLGMQTLEVMSYLEVLGALVAHRAGISTSVLKPAIAPLNLLKD
jgi:hypothetical protein